LLSGLDRRVDDYWLKGDRAVGPVDSRTIPRQPVGGEGESNPNIQWKSEAFARFHHVLPNKWQPNIPYDFKKTLALSENAFEAVGGLARLHLGSAQTPRPYRDSSIPRKGSQRITPAAHGLAISPMWLIRASRDTLYNPRLIGLARVFCRAYHLHCTLERVMLTKAGWMRGDRDGNSVGVLRTPGPVQQTKKKAIRRQRPHRQISDARQTRRDIQLEVVPSTCEYGQRGRGGVLGRRSAGRAITGSSTPGRVRPATWPGWGMQCGSPITRTRAVLT